MAKKAAKRGMQFYKSYSFVDKDPIIDQMRSMAHGHSYRDIQADTGVSTTTLYNWFKGKTRRPSFCCVMAVTRGLEHDIVIVDRSTGKQYTLPSRVAGAKAAGKRNGAQPGARST